MIDWMNNDRSSFILTIRSSLLVSIHAPTRGRAIIVYGRNPTSNHNLNYTLTASGRLYMS